MGVSGHVGERHMGTHHARYGLGIAQSGIVDCMVRLAAGLALSWLVACAHVPGKRAMVLPALRLAPAALGCELALQQRLHIQFGEQVRDFDALLEVDASEVRLMVQALGQTGVKLHWDGHELQQQRAAWLPPMVRAERVLDDLQFALWPAASIRGALPPGWSLSETDGSRELRKGETTWLVVAGVGTEHVQLENMAEGYRLNIDSISNAPMRCGDGMP